MIVFATRPTECVIAIRISVNCNQWIGVERLMNRRLRFGWAVLVLAGDVKHQRRREVLRFIQALLNTDTVIPNSTVGFKAHRQQIGEVSTQAKTNRANATTAS